MQATNLTTEPRVSVADRFFLEELLRHVGPEISLQWLSRRKDAKSTERRHQGEMINKYRTTWAASNRKLPSELIRSINHKRSKDFSCAMDVRYVNNCTGVENRSMVSQQWLSSLQESSVIACNEGSLPSKCRHLVSSVNLGTTDLRGHDKGSTKSECLGLLFTDAAYKVLDQLE